MDDITIDLIIDDETEPNLKIDDNDISRNLKICECIVDGTDDYNKLRNKPSIEDVTLVGNKTFPELGLHHITNMEIEHLLS